MTAALTLAVAYALGVVGVARAVRLITSDAYPPMQVLRDRWVVWQANRDIEQDPLAVNAGAERTGLGHGWGPLLTCPFCCAPYVTAAALAVTVWAGVWSPDLHTLAGWWWTCSVWASVSYLAAMIVVRDEPPPVYDD